MTSRERLLAAWKKQIPDRVPIYIRGVDVLSPRWRSSVHPSYQPLIAEVDEHCDKVVFWVHDSGFYFTRPDPAQRHTRTVPVDEAHVDDHLTIDTPAGPLTSITRRSLIGEPGMITKHFIADLDDLDRFLSIPSRPAPQDPAPFFEIDRRVGDAGITLVALPHNPIGLAHTLMGSETLALWSALHRELLLALLTELARRFLDFVKSLVALGVGPLFSTLGHEVCLPPLQSPHDFRDFVVAIDQPFMDLIHDSGGMVHVHCHSNPRDVLDGFIALRTDVLHPFEAPPMGDITLRDAKAYVRGKICIEGNMQIGDLMRLTSAEIRDKTAEIIADAAEGGGLILCPTASPYTPVLDDRQLENYRAFIHTALDLGRY